MRASKIWKFVSLLSSINSPESRASFDTKLNKWRTSSISKQQYTENNRCDT